MKKTFFFMTTLLLFVLLMVGCDSAPKDVVAKVGKHQITLEELNEASRPMLPRWRTFEEAVEGKMGMLENLVNQRLILMAAYQEGMDKDSVLIQRISGNEENRVLNALWQIEIVEKSKVTDKMVQELYDQQAVEFNAAHILVADEETAKAIAEKAKAGEDFAKLAQENSTDTGTASKGGDLGWFTVRQMVKPFEDAVLALSDGQISDPVQTQYGYHIIKRMGTRERSREPLEKVKESLHTMVERELISQRQLEFVNGMFDNRGFKTDDKAIEVVVNKYKSAQNESPEQGPVTFTDDEKAMTIAQWDEGVWTIGDLSNAMNSRPMGRSFPLLSPSDVQDFIKGNLQSDFLMKEADRLKIKESEKYNELFTKEIEDLMISQYQNQNIYGKIDISEEQVRAYYDANIDSFMDPKTVVVTEVQVAEEAEAQDIAQKVRTGADISKFVEQKSLRTYTKADGGKLEITDRRFPNLWQAVASANVGDIVGPAKDRTNRWSVMKVTEVREPKPMAFEAVTNRIQTTLRRNLRDKAMEDFVAKARSEFKVKIYEDAVKASIDASVYQPQQPTAVNQ